jgi:Fe-S oxidoreductase
MDSDIARVVYECSLCGGCTEQCVTGHDPTAFTRAARTEAAAADIVPDTVNNVIHNLMNAGNPFGMPQTEKDNSLGEEINNLPRKADVLLFIGCTSSYKMPKTALAAISLLHKANVNFTVLHDEKCCGLYLADLIGRVEESRQHGLQVAEQVKHSGAKTVVALCPSCTKAFKREYREWGIDLPAEIYSITSYLAGLLAEGRLQPRKIATQVTFHDPCRLARDLEETEPARKIIESMGMNLKEMFFNRAKTHCCGGGLLDLYAPELTASTARGRWDEASRKADTMLVACSSCQLVMEKARPDNMRQQNIVETLWEQCN